MIVSKTSWIISLANAWVAPVCSATFIYSSYHADSWYTKSGNFTRAAQFKLSRNAKSPTTSIYRRVSLSSDCPQPGKWGFRGQNRPKNPRGSRQGRHKERITHKKASGAYVPRRLLFFDDWFWNENHSRWTVKSGGRERPSRNESRKLKWISSGVLPFKVMCGRQELYQ